ncbi:DUF6918 family protein [Corynebacterium choanae]|uniref:Uncharacterized protein n=1 Tax=Corynebacterium choanae TaxID=1862358 RepID=A0A3G6J2Z9_9CORY|nr:hypothetical protein [Corynebacterium choanae]AZA12441.1 hypothetical protein CCHOA_00030 [Corynebacterium choanae]
MTTLREAFTSKQRPKIAAELVTLIDDTIAGYKGFTGTAIKTTVGAVKKTDPNLINRSVQAVIPEFADAMQPLWDAYTADNTAESFSAYVLQDPDNVADYLLSHADKHTDRINNKALAKLYASLRNRAVPLLKPALGPMAAIVQRYAPQV